VKQPHHEVQFCVWSYDHWVRTAEELNELIRYVENNPVQAGLVESGVRWPWSSAYRMADDALRSSAPREPLQI
jgi:hypothetical protein